MRTTLRAIALAVVTTLALAGCIRMEYALTLNSDNTASGDLTIAVQEGSGEQVGSSDEDLAQDVFDELAGDFEGGESEPFRIEGEDTDGDGEIDQPGWVGTRVTFDDVPIDDAALSAGDTAIARDGDEFVVDADMSGLTSQEGFELLRSTPTMTFAVTFPGQVTEHNGTLDGTTVTWDLMEMDDEPLHARGAADAGGYPVWLIVVIGAVMGVGIGVLFVLLRKKPPAQVAEDATVDPAVLGAPEADAELDPDAEPKAP